MGILVEGKDLWRALFSRTRRRVLSLLFGHPQRSFYASEVVRLAGVGTGSVQRELARLSGAGLLTVQRIGKQVHYQANRHNPFYPELRALVLKTFGALDLLRQAVSALEPAPELAILYGPGIGAMAAADEPLDLLVVGEGLRRAKVEPGLAEAGARLSRNVRLTLVSSDRFHHLLEAGDARLADILRQPRLVLAGSAPGEGPDW